jgi:hypothetical protein
MTSDLPNSWTTAAFIISAMSRSSPSVGYCRSDWQGPAEMP